MLHKDVGTSETPRRRSAVKEPVNATPVSGGKRRFREIRLYKDHQDAYITRSLLRRYRVDGVAEEKSCVISMFRLDDVWYIRLTSSLARFVGYKDSVELRKAHPGDVYTFKTVAYGDNSSYSELPPLTSNVHDTSFLRYDKYKKWLSKTEDSSAFLPFIMRSFVLLRTERDFVPNYTTKKPLVNYNDVEEIPDVEITPDPLVVSAPGIISGKFHDQISFEDRYKETLRIIQEQEQHTETDERIRLQDEVRFLRSRINNLVPFRDGLAKASFMGEGSEAERKAKSQHIKTLMSLAAEDKAASGE